MRSIRVPLELTVRLVVGAVAVEVLIVSRLNFYAALSETAYAAPALVIPIRRHLAAADL
jgi:hypothetical protein